MAPDRHPAAAPGAALAGMRPEVWELCFSPFYFCQQQEMELFPERRF